MEVGAAVRDSVIDRERDLSPGFHLFLRSRKLTRYLAW